VWTLSGFIDEISDDFSLQCTIAGELGLRYVVVRSAWGTNILDLDDGQLSRVRETLGVYGLKVSSIGSPIGKISIDDEFPPHLERMRHAVEVAKTLEAPYIRIFSFFIPEGTDPDSRRDEVLSRMEDLADVAADSDVILVHENEKDIYGDIPRRCLDIVTSVASPQLRPAWDPANFVRDAAPPCELHPDQGRAAGEWNGRSRRRWRRRGAGDGPRPPI
jgi:sugar phosphate isomerase/epimerase